MHLNPILLLLLALNKTQNTASEVRKAGLAAAPGRGAGLESVHQ